MDKKTLYSDPKITLTFLAKAKKKIQIDPKGQGTWQATGSESSSNTVGGSQYRMLHHCPDMQ